MDILGSIMKKMERPPELGEKERQRLKQQRELAQKQKEQEQRRWQEFRDKMQKKITEFAEDEIQERLQLNPMNKPQRAIVHDMAETARLVALSFGQEEIDRHVILFKHDTAPCEAEILALRRGEKYNPDAQSALQDKEEEDERQVDHRFKAKARHQNKRDSRPEYLQKYEKHLGGLEVAKDAAKGTATSRSYGFVSSEQKKDKRTIEETLADIRAKKKLRSSAAEGEEKNLCPKN